MQTRPSRPLALIILDGWGFSNTSDNNALSQAHTPHYDDIGSRYPRSLLTASGESVGLSTGEPGNAEAGHLNLGSGRIVKSDISRIESAIRSGEFFSNDELIRLMQSTGDRGKPLHLVGMVSDGGVHSSSATLYALLRMAKKEGLGEVFVHCILDGRDVPPRMADVFLEALEIKMDEIGLGKIATLCGRHFAMDSAENWDRTARAFTMMVHSEGERASDPSTAVRSSFLRGIADEFTAPIVIETSDEKPVGVIRNGDGVVFFNHRADTMRQLVRALAVPDPGSPSASAKPSLNVVCLIDYDRSFNLPVAFPNEVGGATLNSVFLENGIPSFRFAEADRFPHVTGFLNGGVDSANQFQRNLLVNGPRVSLERAEPEMGSFKLTDQLIQAIEADRESVFVANLSAAGLSAETGDFEKTVDAVQYIDTCLGGIYETISEKQGIMIVASTHGNCEHLDALSNQNMHRPGTTNPVPFHLIDTSGTKQRLRTSGSLQDIAPTIFGLLGIEKPADMQGVDLRIV